MILTDEVFHNCLAAVENQNRVPTYYLWSMDINSSDVQRWLIKEKYIKMKPEIMWISKFLSKGWSAKCPVTVKIPSLTFKGLWKIWALRYNHPEYDVDFVDYEDIK